MDIFTNFSLNFSGKRPSILRVTQVRTSILNEIQRSHPSLWKKDIRRELRQRLEHGPPLVATTYLTLGPVESVRYLKASSQVVGGSRWYIPPPNPDLSRVISSILMLQTIDESVKLHIYHTGNVLDRPVLKLPPKESFHVPDGLYATPVQREFPHESTAYLLGSSQQPRQSLFFRTVECVDMLSPRFADLLDLATLYRSMSWCPDIQFKVINQDQLCVTYAEDDGPLSVVLDNKYLQMDHLETYVYRDLFQYMLELAAAGYVLQTWDPQDWRSSRWNTLDRQITLISARNCRNRENDTSLIQRFYHNVDILSAGLHVHAKRRETSKSRVDRFNWFCRKIRSDNGFKVVSNHLNSLLRPQFKADHTFNLIHSLTEDLMNQQPECLPLYPPVQTSGPLTLEPTSATVPSLTTNDTLEMDYNFDMLLSEDEEEGDGFFGIGNGCEKGSSNFWPTDEDEDDDDNDEVVVQ